MSEKKNKNLEAENEAFKGAFRTPFAFLFGGPVGVIANIIYTIFKAHDEVKQEEKRKEWWNAQFVNVEENGRRIKEQKRLEADKKVSERDSNIAYLRGEFDDCEDISFDEWFKCKCIFYKNIDYNYDLEKQLCRVSIQYTLHESFGAKYLPMSEFVEKYKSDLDNGFIEKKYKLYGKKAHVRFCYKIKDKKYEYYCSGYNIKI